MAEIQATEPDESGIFEKIAQELFEHGYCVLPHALPKDMTLQLQSMIAQLPEDNFHKAGVGRNGDLKNDMSIRRDQISWINNETEAGASWLDWTNQLMTYLNRRLFLGLSSFESHFAHYGKGDFYKKHLDAFKGSANRTLSLVTYLNKDWQAIDGGELIIYHPETDKQLTKVLPEFGTLVIFLSEEFPHEVLPAKKERLSIAGWFRINSSQSGYI